MAYRRPIHPLFWICTSIGNEGANGTMKCKVVIPGVLRSMTQDSSFRWWKCFQHLSRYLTLKRSNGNPSIMLKGFVLSCSRPFCKRKNTVMNVRGRALGRCVPPSYSMFINSWYSNQTASAICLLPSALHLTKKVPLSILFKAFCIQPLNQ